MNPIGAIMLADIAGLLLFPIGLTAVAFWIWMIVDCARHETGGTMIAWLLAILSAGVIAAPLYFFLRRMPRQRSAQFHLVSFVYQPWQKNRRIRQ